jgi:hypothetical protein
MGNPLGLDTSEFILSLSKGSYSTGAGLDSLNGYPTETGEAGKSDKIPFLHWGSGLLGR